MSENQNTTNESQVEPTFAELLLWSGMAPEQFRKLNDEQLAEWRRYYHAKKAGLYD